ncbi:MAG: phosphatidate cytidylyltransferase [Deltaproteobacteria bacterium]|nr:phosphatidate cytidylyltransferase [Deltaproteobacteria bacterium]
MKVGNLATRVLTAAVLAPLLVLAINWHNPIALWAIVFAATLVALAEYFAMTLDDPIERRMGTVLGAAIALALFFWPHGFAVAFPATIVLPALFFLFRFGELSTVVTRLGTMSFGVVYAGVLPTYLSLCKSEGGAHGAGWVYLVLMTAWFSDTGAYFAGRLLGKKKLYPAISPGKTWAGALGGLGGAFLGAVLANLWFFPELGWGHGAALTLLGGVLGQCGDLVESMIKRARSVKDSGNLLPGHGGMLDRIDAVLFIAPWVYLYRALIWQ